jgi:WhiB family redox-sensing transcriptional regulator
VLARGAGGSWQTRASCRGPQGAAFFPPGHAERREERLEREREAKSICGSCPVSRSCLEYALAIKEPHGIWGGLSETERKQLLDRRAG